MLAPNWRKPSALVIISLCFVSSGLLRIGPTGAALAKELAEMTETTQAAADSPAPELTCSADQAPQELMSAIRERVEILKQQEFQLAERKQVLAVIEIKATEQLTALKEAEAKLAATLAIADKAAEMDLARLTAVYESMKPKAAAGIFAGMDIGFAAGFLARMRPDAAAEIMAGLPADRAYAISLKMAGRNSDVPTE